MEIISEKLNKSSGEQERILSIVSGKINSILAHPKDDFCDQINTILERMLNYSIKNLNDDDVSQKNYFDHICHFMNSLFGNTNIKKFYNTAPKISYKEYAQMNLGSQVTHNIYGKDWQLFYRNEVGGGSCHHWTILLKNLFDRLKKGGLDIKSQILVSKITGGHSFIIVNFQGNNYIADVGLFQGEHRIISNINDLDNISNQLKQFSFQEEYHKNMYQFDDIEEFAHYLDQKQTHNIAIDFRPKLEDTCKKISLSINHTGIILEIDEECCTFNLPKKFSIPSHLSTSYQIFDYLFSRLSGDKEDKIQLQKYLGIIANKINIQTLRSLFQS